MGRNQEGREQRERKDRVWGKKRQYQCGPGKGMNQDYGSYVYTNQWQLVCNRMGRGRGGVKEFSISSDHRLTLYGHASFSPDPIVPFPLFPTLLVSSHCFFCLFKYTHFFLFSTLHQQIMAKQILPKYLVTLLSMHMYFLINKYIINSKPIKVYRKSMMKLLFSTRLIIMTVGTTFSYKKQSNRKNLILDFCE